VPASNLQGSAVNGEFTRSKVSVEGIADLLRFPLVKIVDTGADVFAKTISRAGPKDRRSRPFRGFEAALTVIPDFGDNASMSYIGYTFFLDRPRPLLKTYIFYD